MNNVYEVWNEREPVADIFAQSRGEAKRYAEKLGYDDWSEFRLLDERQVAEEIGGRGV